MDYRWKWNSLRERLELGIDEGVARDFNNHPDSIEGAMFNTFKKVLEDMDALDAECAKMELKATCGLNYEAEYERLKDENNCLKEKMFHIEEKAKYMCDEIKILNAKMSVVNLIFGKD